ncbi:MAG: hypothetical protein ACR2IJ_06010 [Fluviibacter sp.]
MSSLVDFGPGGYKEWFINSGKYRFGNPNRAEVFASQAIQDVVAVAVVEAQIPYTFYTINANNNKIAVLKISAGTPSGYYMTIPPGNYSPDTLCTALTSQTATVWPSLVAGSGALFQAASYSTQTGKLTLTVNSSMVTGSGWYYYCNTDLNAQFPVAARNNSLSLPTGLCIEPIGVADIRGPSDLALTPGIALQLPYAIALGGPPYLAIRGNFGIGGGDNIVVCEESSDQKFGGNILCMIPVNTVPGGTITWKNSAARGGFFSLTAAQVESATFWVTTGDDDTVLDFNGHGFQFKLAFMSRNRGSIQGGSRYTYDRNVTTSSRFQ